MKMNEYQDTARKTAVYPEGTRVAYPAIGLIGELGEMCDSLEGGSREDIRGELGDVLWYAANLCCDLHMALTDCLDLDYQSTFFDFNPRLNPNVVKLGSVGHFMEAVKKYIRDENMAKRETIRVYLGHLLRHLQAVSFAQQTTLNDIARENLDKLLSRKKRGVLQGDGDNR